MKKESGYKTIIVILLLVVIICLASLIVVILLKGKSNTDGDDSSGNRSVRLEDLVADDGDDDSGLSITGKHPKKNKETLESEDASEDEINYGPDANNPYRHEITMTLSEVKAEEERIRNAVNGNLCRTITMENGKDGSPWYRTYWIYNDDLIFAFYKDATDGSLDQRFYFKNGCLIEWIPYTGNGAPDSDRYFVSDVPLHNNWYDIQEKVLRESGLMPNQTEPLDATSPQAIMTSELSDYECYVLMNINWDGGKYSEGIIDFAQNRAEAAKAALSIAQINEQSEDKLVFDEYSECYFISEDVLRRNSEKLFGFSSSVNDLPEYSVPYLTVEYCQSYGKPSVYYDYTENETDYMAIDVTAKRDSYGQVIVTRDIYCGYWGNNKGIANYRIEYTFGNEGGNNHIKSMKITSIQ